MLRILPVLSFLFLAAFALRASAETQTSVAQVPASVSQEFVPNIQAGNVHVGGSFGYHSSTYGPRELTINPAAEYFVVNRLAIGGQLNSTSSENRTNYGFGPTLSYHFWQQERWSSDVGGGYFYHQVSETNPETGSHRAYNYQSVQARLGLNYFFNSSVSFGPLLTFDRILENSTARVPQIDYQSVVFNLEIFL